MKPQRIIGLQRKKVKLVRHNKKWSALYKKEVKLLRSVIGKYIKDIQHVGSTSIPAAKAKPIIDIMIGTATLNAGYKCVKPLEKIGYVYKNNALVKGRHFFAKGAPKNQTFYLHVEPVKGKGWQSHIFFRDYLLNHPQAVKDYNKLRQGLAKKHKNDRDTYTAMKGDFIQKILKRAKINS